MSYNVQDKLTFIVEIQKRGDVSAIQKIVSDITNAYAGATRGQRAFTADAVSSSNQINAAVAKNIAVYNNLGKAISSSYTPITQFNAAVGKTASVVNSNVSANQKLGSSYAVLGNNAKSSIGVITQFDTTVRRSATTMNAGVASANAYSAIFRTIPAAVQAGTAALNANTAALTQNTARAQQYGAVMKNVTSSTAAQGAAFTSLNNALATHTKASDQATTSTERRNQAIIQNARGMSTLVLSFAMLNSAATDYRINQESMADITQKVTDAKERLAEALEKYGEGSFKAEQAADALAKAERGLRFELREQQNQLNNMLFLYILIGQEIASNAVPAFLRWGETVDRLRGGFNSFVGLLGRARGGISEFSTTLVGGTAPLTLYSERLRQMPTDIDMVTTSQGRFRQEIMNSDGTIRQHAGLVGGLSEGYYLYNSSLRDTERSQSKASAAADKLRGGFTRISGVLGGAGGTAGLLGGMAALAIGTALYASNAGGARDAINSLGVGIGAMNPLLATAGNLLVGVAGAMGLTGESASQVDHHFKKAAQSFDELTTNWHNALETMQNDTNVMVSVIGNAINGLSETLSTFGQMASGEIGKIDVSKDQGKEFEKWQRTMKQGTDMGVTIGDFGKFKELEGDEDAQWKMFMERWNAIVQSGDESIHTPTIDSNLRKALDKFDQKSLSRKQLEGMGEGQKTNRDDYLNSLRAESELFAQLEDDTNKYNKAHEDYVNSLTNATIQGEMVRNGKAQYLAQFAQEAVALKTNSAFLGEYERSLSTTAGQMHEVAKGRQAQREQGIKEQAELYQLIGTYAELYGQVTEGTALETAYRTGVVETNIALLNRGKELAAQTGSLDAYGAAIKAGTVHQLAFIEGINSQREVLFQTIEATSTATGVYAELNAQLEEGSIQNAAWNKGLIEGRVATLQQMVAISEAAGAFQAYNESIANGSAQTMAYTQGALDMTKATAENFVALSNAEGALAAYTELVAQGIPQFNAYHKAVTDQNMAFQQMAVDIEALRGTNDAFAKGLAETANQTNMVAMSYQKGRSEAQAFAQQLVTAGAETNGYILELDRMAAILGEGLPESFELTREGAEKLTTILSGSVGAMKELAQASHDAGIGMLDGVVTAIKDGGKEVNEELEKLEESIGVNFPEGVKDALESAGLGEAMAGNMTEVINMAQVAWDAGASTFDVTTMVNDKANEWLDEWDNMTVPMQQKTKGIFDMIRQTISEGPGPGENGMFTYLQTLDTLFTAAKNAIDPTAQSLDTLNQINFNPAITQMNAYISSLERLAATMKTVEFDENGLTGSFSTAIGTGSAAETGAQVDGSKFPKQKGKGDDLGVAEGIQSLEELKTKASEVFNEIAAQSGQMTSTVVTNFGTMATGAGGIMAALATASQSYFQLVGAASSMAVPIVVGSFTAMVNGASAQLGILVVNAQATFAAAGTTATAFTVGVTTAFNQAFSNANGVLASMQQQAAARFAAIGSAARVIAVNITTHYNTGRDNAQGVLATMESNAKDSAEAIGDSFIAVATGMNDNFKRGADDAAGYINDLTNHVESKSGEMVSHLNKVASAMDKIGSSATSAKTKVDSLASAINSLKDKTVTITYRQVTTGSRPSGASRPTAMGTTGIYNFAEGGGLFDNQTIVTGESGSELVQIYDRMGRVKKRQRVDNVKSFGLQKGESIQVQPLEGFYGQQFLEKFGNILNAASGQNWYYQNQNGKINTNIPGLLPDNTPGSGIGNSQTSPFSDVAPFVPTNGSTIGRPYSDGTDTVFTADPYNRNLTASEWGKSYLGGGRWYDPVTGKYYTGMGPAPGTPGGPGTGGGGTPGNGNGGSSGPTQIVTTPDGKVRIEQGNGKQSIIIDGKEMLPQNQMREFGDAVDDFSDAVDNEEQNNNSNGTQFTDDRGNNYNNQNDTNTNSNTFGNNGTNVGNDPLQSSSNTEEQGSTDMDRNFGNGKYYRSTNGKVETNMTPEEIAMWKQKYPWLPLDPSQGTGGGGSTPGGGSAPVGKIWNLNLPAPSSNPNAAVPFNYENDPMGWHNYGLIPDPLFRERADRPDVVGGTPGTGNPPGGTPGFPFDWSWIADLLRQILGTLRLGRNTQVNIGSRNIIDIVQGGIMDGFSNFK